MPLFSNGGGLQATKMNQPPCCEKYCKRAVWSDWLEDAISGESMKAVWKLPQLQILDGLGDIEKSEIHLAHEILKFSSGGVDWKYFVVAGGTECVK